MKEYKTTVSIVMQPDMIRWFDETANATGRSRSELIREALADFIERKDAEYSSEK